MGAGNEPVLSLRGFRTLWRRGLASIFLHFLNLCTVVQLFDNL